MTKRSTIAGLATAFVLGAGALLGGSLATSTAAEAKHGFKHGGFHGKHGHHGWGHHGPHWGGHGWGYRPVYAGYYAPRCFTVLRARYVPGLGLVERPVTRCR